MNQLSYITSDTGHQTPTLPLSDAVGLLRGTQYLRSGMGETV